MINYQNIFKTFDDSRNKNQILFHKMYGRERILNISIKYYLNHQVTRKNNKKNFIKKKIRIKIKNIVSIINFGEKLTYCIIQSIIKIGLKFLSQKNKHMLHIESFCLFIIRFKRYTKSFENFKDYNVNLFFKSYMNYTSHKNWYFWVCNKPSKN